MSLEAAIKLAVREAVAEALAGRMGDDRLVPLKEACEMLALSRTSVEEFVRQRKLKRWGGSTKPLFRLRELHRFIEEMEER